MHKAAGSATAAVMRGALSWAAGRVIVGFPSCVQATKNRIAILGYQSMSKVNFSSEGQARAWLGLRLVLCVAAYQHAAP